MFKNFFPRVSGVVSQTKPYRENLSNETIVSKVLRSLTKDFDHVVAAIEESKDLSKCSFDELIGSLLAHEVRISRSYDKAEEKVFHVKGDFLQRKIWKCKWMKPWPGRGGYHGRGRGNGRGRVSLASSVNPKAIYNVDIATNLTTKKLNVGLSRKMRQSKPTMLSKL